MRVCCAQPCVRLFAIPPVDCSPPGSSVHGDFAGENAGVSLTCPPPGDLPDPGIEPGSPALQGDFLPTEPPANPPGCLGYLDILYSVQVPKRELYVSESLLVKKKNKTVVEDR